MMSAGLRRAATVSSAGSPAELDFLDDGDARARDDRRFGGSRRTMACGVASRRVDIELVVRMFDRRDAKSALREMLRQLFDQGRLAGIRPSGNSEKRH